MLYEYFHQFEAYLLSAAVCLPRIVAFFSTALLFSQASMTRMSRNGLVLTLAMPVAPLVYATLDWDSMAVQDVLIILAKEFIVGFFLGYTVGWIFWGAQAAGALIDNQRGASIAESIDPLQGHQTSPLGNLFSQAIMVYMFISGGILFLLGILYQSYQLWPIASLLPVLGHDFPTLFLSLLDTGMRLAFVLAAPVVAIMFLAEMSLAMISRFAPQVQVFILAMPIKSGLAIFILIMYVSILIPEAANEQGEAYRFALKMFESFGVTRDGAP